MRKPRPPSKACPVASRAKIAIIDYQAGNLFSVTHACEAVGLDPVGGTPEKFGTTMRADLETYSRIAKAANMKVE